MLISDGKALEKLGILMKVFIKHLSSWPTSLMRTMCFTDIKWVISIPTPIRLSIDCLMSTLKYFQIVQLGWLTVFIEQISLTLWKEKCNERRKNIHKEEGIVTLKVSPLYWVINVCKLHLGRGGVLVELGWRRQLVFVDHALRVVGGGRGG